MAKTPSTKVSFDTGPAAVELLKVSTDLQSFRDCQRMSVEPNDEARRIMEHAQREEFLHFAMDLEFLARRKEKWRTALQKILFSEGDIVGRAEQAGDAVEQ